MEDLHQIKIFVQEAEKFKLCERYKTMPEQHRDFFNEELGRFKMLVELNEIAKTDNKNE